MKKKLLAILLALGLVITCMPMAAFAATEITENPLKLEKTGEKAYTVSLTMPSDYLGEGVDSVEMGFSFPDKFALTSSAIAPNTFEGSEGDTFSWKKTTNVNANKNHEIKGSCSYENGNYIKSDKGIVLTADFTTKETPTSEDGEFKIISYLVAKNGNGEAADTTIVEPGNDKAAFTLNADNFAVKANSAEGTAEHTHTYGAPTYKWNYDDPENVTCTATKTCTDANCSGEGKTVTETVTMQDGKVSLNASSKPSCTEAGEEVYTATFADGSKTKGTRVLPALGHTYGNPTYEWNYDDPENVTCTASRKCETDPNHIETEEATVTSEVTQEATCMQKKETTYTATFENTAFEKQTKVVTGAIDPNNHDYTVTYAWDLSNQSGVTCTATRECKRNEAHDKKIEEAKEIKENIIGKATCTSTGKKTYTASFDSFAPSESEEVEIPATGHDFENSKDYLHDSTQHWKKCKNCDAGEENKKENHTGINKCDICGYEKTYTVTCNVMRYGVRDDVEITGYLCKKDGSYSDKITDDQFRKGDTGLQENEIKKVSTTGNKITFNGVTAGNYVLVILGDERTRSTRVAFVVDGDNISRQAKLYLFGDVNGDGDLTEEDVEKFMDVVVGNSICDDTIQAALGYRVQGRPKAVDITNARRIMGV